MLLVALFATGCTHAPPPTRPAPPVVTATLTGDVNGTHDPSIAFDHGTYYVFATGAAYPRPGSAGQLPVRCSSDLTSWSYCGAVFPSIPAWIHERSPATRDLWAPDVSFYGGLYHLYYSFSIFGKITSGIALATSPTLDPARAQWTDRGLVLDSHPGDNFNAIDPNLILDDAGAPWLAFGSYWSGIKLRRLDPATGLLSAADRTTYSLAARARVTTAIEAPFLFHHAGFYYLFVAWDQCCKGAASTYRTMVGRSKALTGPYVDRQGTPMLAGGGTPVLTATPTWAGPGGASILHTPDRDLIVYHAYNTTTGKPALQISPIDWQDGWPTAAVPNQVIPQGAPPAANDH